MKLVHLSDLHLGKKVNEFSMIEDQQYILRKILEIIDAEQPDGVIIAGDVYDKTVPSAEAIALLDDFLFSLSKRDLKVFVISGNHDSAERLAFCTRLIERSGVHISQTYNGHVETVRLEDEYGLVDICLLPFVKPVNVRKFYPDEDIESYTDAIKIALSDVDTADGIRKVLVTHQFVTGASRSESEDFSVGGSDNIDASVFEDFDYVALGHIHGPQNIGSERIRYCGTPLKYSFSEAEQNKSVTVINLGIDGNLDVRTRELEPLHDMVELKGSYEELTLKSFYEGTSYQTDYVHITLTDEDDIPDAIFKLRVIYHNLMKLDYDNARTRHISEITRSENVDKKTPLELCEEFFEKQNGSKPDKQQEDFLTELIERIWEESK
ncbi:MAG: exonuclease SbcCD subunit D [Clostridiales bacterium]|nr:exonuclease SbcCD subunit D [Clostridiales bacterium]